jgi:hypothetical protein
MIECNFSITLANQPATKCCHKIYLIVNSLFNFSVYDFGLFNFSVYDFGPTNNF